MLRARASSRFAPLRSLRTLSVTGSVAGGAGGAACWVLLIAAPPVVTLMSRVTRSSCGVIRFQTRPADLRCCRKLAEPPQPWTGGLFGHRCAPVNTEARVLLML